MADDDTHGLDGVEHADAVESIRNQLIDAATRAGGMPVAFAVGDIQMEFTLKPRREEKAGGKVKAWVVEAGADTSRMTVSPERGLSGVLLTVSRFCPGPGAGDRATCPPRPGTTAATSPIRVSAARYRRPSPGSTTTSTRLRSGPTLPSR